MTRKDIKELLKRYNSGTCTDEEIAFLESWYLQFKGGDFDLSQKELESIKNDSWQDIVNLNRQENSYPSWFRYAAAVFIFAFLSIGIFLYSNKESGREQLSKKENIVENDLIPGGNKATLTLSDGSVVSLDESANGVIAQVEGMDISKTSDGQIVYRVINKASLKEDEGNKVVRYNQITTPRGGQYQIVLPDGTKVWLNAASSLRYPEYFDGQMRHVELLGEAYFEVNSQESALGNKIPFLVSTSTQTIEVLGTHFNINSYKDEKVVKTTLLEGAVRVSINSLDGLKMKEGVVLKPNQQSILNGSDLNVIKVNPEESVAWKNGYFSFEHADIETVMRQLSRWYDVDIVYEGKMPSGSFTGKVYRNMKISKVLEILSYAQVNFKIEGETMTIFS